MRSKSRKISTLDRETSCSISTKKPSSSAMKPAARRNRNKNIKKPKFLSLRLQLSNHEAITQPAAATTTLDESITSCSTSQKNVTDHHHPFPSQQLKRDTAVNVDHESMEIYFGTADGGSTSLLALLNADTTSEENSSVSVAASCSREESDCSLLLRTALRSREREASTESEEKWVCISEVVEHKEEEVSCCEAEEQRWWRAHGSGSSGGGGGGPVLKLDYEEVINAWCDKGPPFVEAESTRSPRVVPDFYDDFLFRDLTSKEGQLWVVPENSLGDQIEGENGEGREGWPKWQREASLLRYKEKRQSRLFSKRIRYEVRKLNAEKRPRVKGRFVKRNEVKCLGTKHM